MAFVIAEIDLIVANWYVIKHLYESTVVQLSGQGEKD